MFRLLRFASALVILASTARAQVALNEIYISHSGVDDMEFAEILGPAGMSLQDHFICVVEGDSGAEGLLDRVIDLSAGVIPADGYFVVGSMQEPATDLVSVPASNIFDNGTSTFYLIQATDPVGLLASAGLQVGDPATATTTLTSFGTIIDSVAVLDGNFGGADVTFDGATVVGPDGNFVPSGVFRNGDFPNDWNDFAFLDFNDQANENVARTPGMPNLFLVDETPTYPGNGGDIEIQVELNGVLDNTGDDLHTITTSDLFQLRMISPEGGLLGNRLYLAATGFPTGLPPFTAPLNPSTSLSPFLDAWVLLGSTFLLVDGGFIVGGQIQPIPFFPALTPSGYVYGPLTGDLGIIGASVIVQAFANAPGYGPFQLASSDAHELIFTF
jgi:hypothetical protein